MPPSEENSSFQERTETPSPQRREEFRKKGQVAQSRELTSILVLMGAMGFLYFFIQNFYLFFSDTFREFSLASQKAMTNEDLVSLILNITEHMLMILLPLLVFVAGVAVFSNILQVGFFPFWGAVSPTASRINPLSGMKRILSKHGLVEAIKAILKISIVTGITFAIVHKELEDIAMIPDLSLLDVAIYMCTIGFKIGISICGVLVIMAGLDYAYQRFELEKKMRMTKQEAKQEAKEREGDPQIKARVRSVQREIAMRRMMAMIPKASVVVTNPTHFAVALEYKSDGMHAPVVVAKGADFIALKIREVAKLHNIPIVENKPLAQTLYKTIKIGKEIPKHMYHAVAEVLAYVYRLKNISVSKGA